MTRVERAKVKFDELLRAQHAAELTALTPDTEWELDDANREYDRLVKEIEDVQIELLEALCEAEEVTYYE